MYKRQALIDLRLFYDLNLHSEAICLSVEVPKWPEHKGGNIAGILGENGNTLKLLNLIAARWNVWPIETQDSEGSNDR